MTGTSCGVSPSWDASRPSTFSLRCWTRFRTKRTRSGTASRSSWPPTVPATSCSATHWSATAPMTGSPTDCVASCTRARPRRYAARSATIPRSTPVCSPSTTSTPSATKKPGRTRSPPPRGRRLCTRTSRRPSSTSARWLAARRLPQLGRRDLAEVHEALGDARNRAGAYVEAAAAYRASRRLLDDDVGCRGAPGPEARPCPGMARPLRERAPLADQGPATS